MSYRYTCTITKNSVRGSVRIMKGQGNKIRGHMVRGVRINDPIRRIIKVGVMDCSVGIGCSEGRAQSSSKGGWKSCKCRGG